jgi:hypothetical protein
MNLRLPTALGALLLAAAPLSAEPPKPTIVVQTKPVARLMGDFREMVRQTAGPDLVEQALKEFDNGLKEVLGEQGFEGLDINRPIGGYIVLRDDIAEATIVLAVPITGEKEFLGLLGRMKLKTEAVKDKPGAYTLQFPEPIFPKASVVHVAGAWAHVSINAGDAVDAKDLIAAETLIDNADPALFTAKLYPDRIPDKLVKTALDQMDQTANSFKAFVGAGAPPNWARLITTFLDDGPKLVRRYVETARKEAAELAIRMTWDAASADNALEFSLVPKAGTPLAKEIAATSVTNRFAGVIPKDAAIGAILKAPLFAEEIRNIVADFLAAGQAELKKEEHKIPQEYHPIIDEVAKSLIGSVKKGQLDAAVALAGPGKDGKFTIVGGFSLDNAPAVEKAARELVKGRDFAKVVQLDADKAGTNSIHKVDLLTLLPESDRREIAKLFGENAPGYVAFASDAVFAAVGPEALARVKTALDAKPGPGPYLDVVGNMKRLHAMISEVGGNREATDFAKILGTDDKTASLARITAEGGEKLSVKLTINARYLPKMIMGFRGGGAAAPPPPQLIK